MDTTAKSTNEIRMIAQEAVRQQETVCQARRDNLKDKINALSAMDETLADLRVKLSEVQTQIKITWALLMLVVGGLVGVAFSVWGKMP